MSLKVVDWLVQLEFETGAHAERADAAALGAPDSPDVRTLASTRCPIYVY